MNRSMGKKGSVLCLLFLLFGMTLPLVPVVQAGIVWDVTLQVDGPGGLTDSVVLGEATNATDGPLADDYDTAKPQPPEAPYVNMSLNNYQLEPYTVLWKEYRYYPDTQKTWDVSIQWVPSGNESSGTITISWSSSEVAGSDYTAVEFCSDTGEVLKDMLVDSSYTFSCLAGVTQDFQIICSTSNRPPVANADSYSMNEDATLTRTSPGVLGNDDDPDGDSLTAVKQSDPSHGTVLLNDDGSFTYTPVMNYYGYDSFSYKAFDGGLYSNEQTVNISLAAVNDAPILTNIPDQTILEGSSFLTIALDSFVSDADDSDLEMTWTYAGNVQLMVSIVGRVATITPPSSTWNGAETILFTATDPGALSDADPATFNVTAVNTPPSVGDIPGQTIPEGSSFSTISLDTYVADGDNPDAQITWSYSGNTQLMVTIVNRIATITPPNSNWYGSETITFRARDPGGLWDEDAAVFSITSVNDAPVVSDIPNQMIVEGASFTTIPLDTYVTDVETNDNQITWTASGNVQLLVSIVNRVATITAPNVNWYGSETIIFRASDPGGLWDDDPAVFTVTTINDAPVLSDFSNQTIAQGSLFTTIPLDNYVSDVDHTDAQITWTVSGNTQLLVNIVNRIATITTPSINWVGSETITFRATDPTGLWDATSAVFTVTAVNTPPNTPGSPVPANGASAAAISSNLHWSGGDPDGDTVRYDVYFGTSSSPELVSQNQSSLGYDLGILDYATTYYWMVIARDESSATTGPLWHFTTTAPSNGGGGEPDTDTGEMPPELPLNIPPVVNVSAGEPYQGYIDTEVLFNASQSYDPDGSILWWRWEFGDGTNGSEMTMTHSFSQKGTYNVTLTITDDDGASNSTMTSCVITQPNHPPTTPSITGPTKGTQRTVYTFTTMSTDPDFDLIQYTFNWGDSLIEPSAQLSSGASFSVDHSWVGAGRYYFMVSVSDGQATSSSQYVIYIDAVPVENLGYLLDNDSDGTYDAFYSEEYQEVYPIHSQQDQYTIDQDGDGSWDVTFSATSGVASYQEPTRTYGVEIILAVLAIVLYLLWRRRSKNEK